MTDKKYGSVTVSLTTMKVSQVMAGMIGAATDRKIGIVIQSVNDHNGTSYTGVKDAAGSLLYGNTTGDVITWDEFNELSVKVGNIQA